MASRYVLLAAFAMSALGAPAAQTTTAPTVTGTVANPFLGRQIFANPYYASEISASAIPSLPASLVPAASEVAKIGTFVWL